MKKRIYLFLLSCAMLFSVTACGSNQESSATKDVAQSETSIEDANTGKVDEENLEESKILIAYFTAAENSDVDAVSSASVVVVGDVAKGSVQAVADVIQTETGGDLFSIQTEFDYPGNIGALIDYAAGEQEREERPVLTTHIENLDDYDVIFIGYPNWWYDMPMAMYTFFEEYDFAGKTIIPFNTHRGSRFSSTISTIQELEPEATVIEDGFTFPGDDAADAAEDVAEWLNNLQF